MKPSVRFAVAWLAMGLALGAAPPPAAEEPPAREGQLSARPQDAAEITSPAPGSTLPGSTVTFTWSAGTGVAAYYLMVGEWAGGNTLFDGAMGTQRSATVTNLPTDGRAVYVRLWSLLDGEWESRDVQYRAAGLQTPAKAEITSPAPNSVLAGGTVTVEWTAGTGVSRYFLFAGLWAGGNTLFSQDMGTARSATVSGLPTDGRSVYFRLWSLIGEEWVPYDAVYKAAGSPPAPVKAQLTSPAPGSALSGTSATFQWTEGAGVSQYYLFVGLWQGGNTLAAVDAGGTRSAVVTGLPANGETLWVRVWSRIGEQWQFSDAQLKAFDANPGPPAKAELVSPAPGSTLGGSSAQFQWTAGRGVQRYYLFIGNWAGDNSIASIDADKALAAAVSHLPVDGRMLFVRLWSYINGEWTANDYQVRAFRP